MSAQPRSPEQTWREAWQKKDPRRFADAVRRVDWSRATPESMQDAIRAALELGADWVASDLAALGTRHHPEDEALARSARILAPPQVVGTSPATGTALFWVAHTWAKEHAEEYRGKWVLLKGEELLAAVDDLADLRPFKEREDAEDLYLTQIPA